MIVFDLLCSCGNQFEGWFQDSGSFSTQQEEGLVTCPHCGSAEVHKILSPVAVRTGASPAAGPDAPFSPAQGQALWAAAALRTLQKYVEKNFEDVGPDLASTALKIHYGQEEPKNIRGVATAAEEKTLQEEGIKLLKIPMPAKQNDVN